MTHATADQWMAAHSALLPCVRQIRYMVAPGCVSESFKTAILQCWADVAADAERHGFADLFALTDPRPPEFLRAAPSAGSSDPQQ